MNDNLETYASGEIRILDFGLTVDNENDDIWVPVSNLEILPSKSIWSIGLDNNDLLWILTSKGILAFSYQHNEEYISLNPVFDNPLLSHIPLFKGDHIRIDNQNNKWITTKHSGLFLIQSDNSFFPDEEGFNTDNSLILSNIVLDIDFNYEENLAVIGTQNGISLYDMSALPSISNILNGDINSDGQTDVTDAVLLIFYILGFDILDPFNLDVADLNQDEIVDITDVVQLIGLILGISQQKLKNLTTVEFQSMGKEIILEADGGFSAVHLLFSNPIIGDIIHIEGAWEIFQNKNELIMVNMSEHSNKSLTIQLSSSNILLSGRICSINAVCLDIVEIPTKLSIEFTYPNPFNPIAHIGISVPENGYYNLTIFDINGRFIQNIISGELEVGKYHYRWIASDKASGIYFVRFSNNDNHFIKKITLLK